MNGLLMMIIAIVVLGGAYLIYGRYLAETWGIDPKAKTPAYELEDGVDYVPADTNVVFGHQFASIAGVAVGAYRRRVFRCGTGFHLHVRLCKEQRPHHMASSISGSIR